MERKSRAPKPCADCPNLFIPWRTTDKYCYECKKIHAKASKPTRRSSSIKKTKPAKKKSKSLPRWIKDLETHFNRYIRARDFGQRCISCDKPLLVEPETGKSLYDAGHFWPVRNYGGIRFHEDNVHGQCKGCNGFLDGNVGEYRIKLIRKIGQERVDALEALRHKPLKLSIPEVQELIEVYKKKLIDL